MKISVYDREVFKWDEIVGEGKVEVVKTGQKIIPIYLKNKKMNFIQMREKHGKKK